MSEKSSTLQIETARVFLPLLDSARYKGAHGGRGSGKSHFFAEMLVEDHIRHPGLRSVGIREIQRSLEQSAKRLIEDKIESLGVGSMFEVHKDRILCPGGGLIIFQGMQNHTADSIKSLEGYDRAWVEEAQSLSQRSLDLLRPTIRKDGSEIWFSWNPRNESDPVDKFLRENPPPNAVVVEANWDGNPWFPDVLREEMEWDLSRDPDKYAHVWMGSYIRNSEARVFKNWKVEEFDAPESPRFYFGADWGFSVDPTVLIRCFIEGRTLYVDQEAYAVGREIDRTPELFRAVPESDKWPITADSARPETIDYMKRHGFPRIKPAKKGKDSVHDGVEFLKSYDIVVHPRCKHTIDELTLYSYKVDKLTDEVLPVLEDSKNHVIDALRYAVEETRRANPTAVFATYGND